MPIEILPEDYPDWIEFSSKPGIEFLELDPWWHVKRSSLNPDKAIVWRGGLGFVDRSTDGGRTWSSKLPQTDPPNILADSVAPSRHTVTYVTMDSSIINYKFVMLATWQNSSGDWRSWMAKTEDEGVTWTWKHISSTGTEITEYLEQTIDASNAGTFTHIVPISTTCFAAYYYKGGISYTPRMYLVSIDGSKNITVEDNDLLSQSIDDMRKQSSTRLISVTLSFPSSNPVLRLYNVSGCSSFTSLDTDNTVMQGSGHGTGTLLLCPLSDTDGLFVGLDPDLVSNFWKVFPYSVSGDTISIDDTTEDVDYHKFWPTFPYADDTKSDVHDMCRMDASTAIILKSQYEQITGFPGDGFMYAQALTSTPGSGTAVALENTANSRVKVDGTSKFSNNHYRPQIVYLRSGVAVACWQGTTNTLYVVAMSLSGTTIVAGTPYTARTGEAALTRIDDNTVQLLIGNFTETLNVSGLAITSNGDGYTWRVGGFSDAGIGTIDPDSSPVLAAAAYNDGVSATKMSFFDVNVSVSSDNNKALGVSIGRDAGANIWTTFCDDSNLYLLENAMSDLSQSQSLNLGIATIVDVDAADYLAYPQARVGHDDSVVVYGRMNNPYSLGNPVHVIYTLNGGTSFVVVESGWGADHCGALHEDGSNNLYVVRNLPVGCSFYTGTVSSLSLAGITDLNDGVNHGGIGQDVVTGAIVLGSNNADLTMVIAALSPYTTWADATLSHRNDRGITGVVVLN